MTVRFRINVLGASIALGLVAVSGGTQVQAANDLSSWVSEGKPVLDMRLRYESVDDDAFAESANALTLRTRLGFKTAVWNGFTAYLEAEDVRALQEHYNSTANGRTQYPTIADPKGSEWNQAYLAWDSGSGNQATVGRQRILLDNQRFFGNSGWRQNEQTFDALALNHRFDNQLMLRYFYVDEVHRVFGHENPNPLLAEQNLDAHLFNLAMPFTTGTLSTYGYFVKNQALPATSTRNLGVRFAGQCKLADGIDGLYAGEFADQADWRGGDSKINAQYELIETGLGIKGHNVKFGYEILGGDGRYGFQTPFATLHAFNGWADRFLTTPVNGLRDRYISASGPLGLLTYTLQMHQYDADHGSANYGRELDAQLAYTPSSHYGFLAKLADYRADSFATDETKIWMQVELHY